LAAPEFKNALPRIVDRSQLWLVRDKPRHDELMSSWIVRLAHAQRMKLESFCFRSWGRGAQIMVGDTDVYPHVTVIEKLALHSGASVATVVDTTFLPLIGTLFEDIPPNGLVQWVTHFGAKKIRRRAQGLSYCPLCLLEDDDPYCRRNWRIAFCTICTAHRVRLRQNCPYCGEPFSIHRWDKGLQRHIGGNPITHCPACRHDRATGGAVDAIDDDALLEFQWTLERALVRGWINIGGRQVDAKLFFSGLAMLTRLMIASRRTDRIRAELLKRGLFQDQMQPMNRQTRFEQLTLAERFGIMRVLAWLFQEWPTRLIDLCATANFSSSYLFDHAKVPVQQIPFWVWEPVHLHLDRSWYAPSDGEIDAAVNYLRKTRGDFKKADLVRMLGVSWLNRATLRKYRNEFR
jgi:hypothetical protein